MAYLMLTNLVINGDFESAITLSTTAGSNGWSSNFANYPTRVANPTPPHTEGGAYALMNSGNVNGAAYVQLASNISIVSGRKYYITCLTRFEGTKYAYTVQFMNAANALPGISAYVIGGGAEGVRNTWFRYDGGVEVGSQSAGGIFTANAAISNLPLRIQWTGGNGNQLRQNYLDQLLMVDVTPLSQAPYNLNDATILAYMRNIYMIYGHWVGVIQVYIPDGPLTIDPLQTLSDGRRGQSYSDTISVTGGWNPYTYSISSGNLPGGLRLNSTTGVINGSVSNTIGNYGTFNFTVQVSDGINTVTSRSYSIYVDASPIIATILLSNIVSDIAYNFQVVADGTNASPNLIEWSLIDGAFPSGISINSAGLITGQTAVTEGNFSVELKADNGISPAATRIFNFMVSSSASIITTSFPNATSGVYYNQEILLSGIEPISLIKSSGDLPSGLSVVEDNGSYYLRGTPIVPNHDDYIFELTATNELGQDIKVFTLTIGIIPAITTATFPNAIQGIGYSTTLQSSGSTPITYQHISGTLPTGIILNPNGTISGTTSQIGVFNNIVVQATNAYGSSQRTFSLTVVQPSEDALITTNMIPNGTVGAYYSFQVNATGFPAPAFGTTVVNFPPGLSINSAGLITGTPITQGVYTFTLNATNTTGSNSRSFTVTIGIVPTITTASPLTGIQGTLFVQTLTATGYPNPTWSATGLPGTMTINSANGTLQWNSPISGTYNFSITATNSYGNDTKSFVLNILLPPRIDTTSLPAGVLNKPYTYTMLGTGDGTLTWYLAEGTFPNGISISSGGIVSGTPIEYGDFEVFIRVTTAYGSYARGFILTIAGPPIITSPSQLPDAGDGASYTYKLQADGTPPITWSVAINSGLPAWLSFNSLTGVLSASSPITGTYTFTIEATNDIGTSSKQFTLEVKTPSLLNESPLYAALNESYSITFIAGGQPPFVFTWLSGNVPSGLTWDGVDTLSGTPDVAGIYTFTIQVQNALSTNTKEFTLYVGAFPVIENEWIPVGEIGIFYSNQMVLSGTQPLTLSIVSGAVNGLTLNTSTLVYYGTPLESGLFQITFEVSNILGVYRRTFSLLITEPSGIPAPDITNDTLMNGVLGQSYSDFVVATGDDLEFAMFSGTLPTGLSLNQYSGEISGTPIGMGGTFNFAVICFNPGGFDIQSYEIWISTPPLILTHTLPDAYIDVPYSFQINAFGDPTITFKVETSQGSETGLPNGLSLSSSGLISGTPTTQEVTTFRITVINASGTYTRLFGIEITRQGGLWLRGKPVKSLFVAGKKVSEAYVGGELIFKK